MNRFDTAATDSPQATSPRLASARRPGAGPRLARLGVGSWNPYQRIKSLEDEIQQLTDQISALNGKLEESDENGKERLKQVTWLNMELLQFETEKAHFGGDAPLHAGSGFIGEVVPPLAGARLRSTVSSPSMSGYLFVADACHSVFSRLLKEHSTVLDIGCGCGTQARNLLYHPYVKRFIGFDVYRESIEWCQHTIVPRSGGRFEFHLLDVFSDAYNPKGTIPGNAVVFPASDDTVDFAYGISLFTHLLEEDSRHYLSEVRRVLVPGGLFLPTILAHPEEGREYSGDEIKVHVNPEYFIKMAEAAGLRLQDRLGSLCGLESYLFTK